MESALIFVLCFNFQLLVVVEKDIAVLKCKNVAFFPLALFFSAKDCGTKARLLAQANVTFSRIQSNDNFHPGEKMPSPPPPLSADNFLFICYCQNPRLPTIQCLV